MLPPASLTGRVSCQRFGRVPSFYKRSSLALAERPCTVWPCGVYIHCLAHICLYVRVCVCGCAETTVIGAPGTVRWSHLQGAHKNEKKCVSFGVCCVNEEKEKKTKTKMHLYFLFLIIFLLSGDSSFDTFLKLLLEDKQKCAVGSKAFALFMKLSCWDLDVTGIRGW